ncbi:MAG: PEP-CTERM sorting domain-containing protein [Planctomycetota bacterium]
MQLTRTFKRLNTGLIVAAAIGLAGHANADFVKGLDPTTAFADLLLDDVTPSTGQDSATATVFNPGRALAITTDTGPQTVTITGVAFNFRGGTSTAEEDVTVTVTYFGDDGNVGAAADNIEFGSRVGKLQFDGTDEYTFVFDTPMVGVIPAGDDRFRISISSTGNMRHKTWNPTQSPSGQNGLKVSVGGTSVPEPASMALVGLGGLLMVQRRRG